MLQPEIRPFDKFTLRFPPHKRLNNGIGMYVVNGGDQEVCKIEVSFNGGTFEEKKPLQALFMSSLLKFGSKKYSSQDISEKLDFYGAWFDAKCIDHNTVVSLHVLNRCLQDILPIFVDILFNPVFPQKEFDLLKNRLLGSFRTARNRVKYLASIGVAKLYYGAGHPLARFITDENVCAVTIEDIQGFHKKYYSTTNCEIIVSGKISESELKYIEDTFCAIPNSECCTADVHCDEIHSDDRFSFIEKPDAVQSAVAMIMPAIPRDNPDYIKLRVLVTALGGYFGSRLMSNIREDKGYTYGINAMLLGRKDGATIQISSECDCAYVEPLIAETKKELTRLCQEPISKEELDMVKSYMMSDLAKTFDTPFSIASYVSSTIYYGVPINYFNEQVECISSITNEALLDIANKYFDVNRLAICVAGKK